MQLILISGLSGSGKSVALNVLEDGGYYCVDNLPAKLLPDLANFLQEQGQDRVAVSIDVRSGSTLSQLPLIILGLRRAGIDLQVLYLEAKTETLVKRYSESRRRHPLSDGILTLPECIARERELLAEVSEFGHHIDTSELKAAQLRSWVRDFVQLKRAGLTLLFQSFAFKHGLPLDADYVFDVRCLPNPFYDPQLRPLTGQDREVAAYLGGDAKVRDMVDDIRAFVERWLPQFENDNRAYLTIAIGCTGGQHRSVYVVEQLADHFRVSRKVLVRHRELEGG